MAKTKDEVRGEALTILRKYQRGGAGISMGVGKTRLGLEHFQLVVNKVNNDKGRPAKALVVAPALKIHKGWLEETAKWNMTHLDENLEFVTYRSLTKKNVNDYDVIYLDECHSLKQKHDYWLSHFGGYIIGLTGTPPKRKSTEKARMVAKYCPIRYEYLTDEAVDDSILNDYRIVVHLLSLGQSKDFKVELKSNHKDPKKRKVIKSWHTSETENYAYWTGALNNADSFAEKRKLSVLRMTSMKKYLSKERYGKKLLEQAEQKCLLFANLKVQADRMCKHSYHSDNKNSEYNMSLFEADQIDKLVCVDQLSQGANIMGLRELVILHMYGNNRKGAQRLGRGLRLNPDELMTAHILCYKDTIDVEWVKEALSDFNQNKIEWYDPSVF
jgi:superfamily II DNA or RNA helicase